MDLVPSFSLDRIAVGDVNIDQELAKAEQKQESAHNLVAADFQTPNRLAGLPTDVWEHIFHFLPVPTLLSAVKVVNRTCYKILTERNSGCWRVVDMRSLTHVHDTHIENLTAGQCWAGLEQLILRSCERVTSKSLAYIAKRCPVLRSLDLQDCPLVSDEGLIAVISSCSNLKELNLKRCARVTDATLEVISANNSNIEHLNLSSCAITDEGVIKIADRCPALKSLSLESTSVTDTAVEAVARKLGSSRAFRTSSSPLCVGTFRWKEMPESVSMSWPGYDPRDVTNTCGLRSLNLSMCQQLTDTALSHVAKHCTSLTHLNIFCCYGISNIGLTYLSRAKFLHQIEELNIGGLERVGNDGIKALLEGAVSDESYREESFTKLRSLNMELLRHITDGALEAVAKCRQLKELNVTKCHGITDAGLQMLEEHSIQLERLVMNYCPRVTDEGLRGALSPELLEISVSGCGSISDAGLKSVAAMCPKLRVLNLRGCQRITDVGVQRLAQCCPALRSLNLFRCKIHDESLTHLASSCPDLKHLDLGSCGNFSAEVIERLAERCPNLRRFNLVYVGFF